MIYFLHGENSYSAIKKINEFKNAFKKKNEKFLIVEADDEADDISEAQVFSMFGQGNLFAKKRLVIFKNIFSKNKTSAELFEKNAGGLKDSQDIFVIWEREPEKEVLALFKKYSEKVQEVEALKSPALDKWLEKRSKEIGLVLGKDERALMIEEAGESAEWALENELEKILLGERPSERVRASEPPQRGLSASETKGASINIFSYVERMFGPRALLAVKELADSGQDVQRFIYILLWKLKQKRMYRAYFEGIKAESQMRRDPKNSEEILEKLISSLPDRQAGLKV